ncbi:MAG: cyclic nucleotide-binding domain-containing protein [Mycobacteriales bacterium]
MADSKIEHVRAIPGLGNRPARELTRFASLMDAVSARSGEELVREGEAGRFMFIVVAVHATVTRAGQPIGSVGPGAFVGEMALLDDGPRSATVTAATDMELLVVNPNGVATLLSDAGVLRAAATALTRRLREANDSALPPL